MGTKVELGGIVEIEGDRVVVTKLGKIHKAGGQAAEGFEKAKKGGTKLAKVFKSLKRAGKGVAKVFKGIGRAAKKIAKIGGIAGALGVGTAALGISAFGDFQLDMARVGTLLDGNTSAMDKFGTSVERASVRFGVDAKDAAGGFFDALSAGVTESELPAFMETIGQATVGGFTSQATAVKGVKKLIDSYGLSIKEAANVSDDLFVANKLGVTTFEELANTVGRAAPLAREVGLDYQELLASITSTTKVLKTSEAVSGIKAVMAGIVKPTQEALDVVSELYDTDRPEDFFGVSAVKAKGFLPFLQDLRKVTGGSATMMAKLFSSTEAFNVVSRLASKEGARDMNIALRTMKDTAGQTAEAHDKVAKVTGFKLKQMRQGISRWVRDIGAGLVEGLKLDEIENVPEFIDRVSKGVRAAAGGFAEGLLSAFDPAFSIGDIDWAEVGRSMGEMAGKIATGIKDMAGAISDLISNSGVLGTAFELLNSMLGGGSPIERAAKRAGAKLFDKGKLKKEERLKAINRRAFAEQGRTFGSLKQAERLGRESQAGGSLFRQIGENDPAVAVTVALRIKKEMDEIVAKTREAKMEAVRLATAQDQQDKLTASAKADAEKVIGLLKDAQTEVGNLADRLLDKLAVTLNLTQEVKTNIDKKPRRPKRSSTKFERGQGDATLPTTFTQMFMFFDGEVTAVPDEFVVRPT